ncbi:MAG: glycosyltransferase family 2 protein [Candidatus Margulisiibacteriota bacterium]|nr:MAG: glycosyltransferase family 2 protein [Candidatus Margulisiibacteriota bacterium]
MLSLTILIITYNEEIHLDRCLQSAKSLTDDIVIIDSYSTDRTSEIASAHNCFFIQHQFTSHADQINWALENVKFGGEWIFRLDADEILTNELILEIKAKLPSLNQSITSAFLKRRVYFMGRWIKHGGYYPTWILRVWRRGHAVCEQRYMDEHMQILDGLTIKFKYDFIDNNLNDLHWWIDKHNKYATKETVAIFDERYQFTKFHLVTGKLFGTQLQRKRWIKENVYSRIPKFVRPFLYFVYRYFFRLGFLDGKEGLIWHFLQGFWYRFLIDAKTYQLEKDVQFDYDKLEKFVKDSQGSSA